MAVAFDAASESHTGSSGSASETSFSWTHTPAGAPAGVLVFTFVNANANNATAVTYGGVSMTAVTGGRAVDTGGEPGDCKAWFLGAGIGTGAKTVQVTRTNNANVMYAVCYTVTAASDTQVAGATLLQENQALTEQNVDDGTWDTNSVRFAATQWGASDIPAVGANSTQGPSIDYGTRTVSTVYETTPGRGSRPVGWDTGATSDDVAFVGVAIKEAARSRQNTAVAPLVGAGGRAMETPRSGSAILPLSARARWVAVDNGGNHQRWGTAKMGLSSYDAWEWLRAGAAEAAFEASGASAYEEAGGQTYDRANIAETELVGAGGRTAEMDETGAGVLEAAASGVQDNYADVAETGLAAAEFAASGTGETQHDRSGGAELDASASGAAETQHDRQNTAAAAFTAAGDNIAEYDETGAAAAAFAAAGTGGANAEYLTTGSAIAELTASADRAVEYDETAAAAAPFVASGASETVSPVDKTGAAAAALAAAGTRETDLGRTGAAELTMAGGGVSEGGSAVIVETPAGHHATTNLTFPAEWADNEEELVLVLALALT